MKVNIVKKDGEYRVPSPDNREQGAYYTEDKEDAINTAYQMHGDSVQVFVNGKPVL